MARENPSWGQERIANELLVKLGLRVSPRTIRKYLPESQGASGGNRRRDQRWSTFPKNHAAAIVACDFFVVASATFRILYVLVVSNLHLYKLLSNPIYKGEIRHLKTCHPGQHEPIIDTELWNKTQLATSRSYRRWPTQRTPTADEEDAAEEAERSATFAPIFQDAGERVARKEREAIERFAKQANTVAEFVAKVDEFYRTYEKTVERIIAPVLGAYAHARRVPSSTATAAVGARGYVSTSRRNLRNVVETASDKRPDISQLMENWEEQRATWIATELPKLVDELAKSERGKAYGRVTQAA